MACPNCGSWAVKSDRGLSGRMVCARCGQPLGLGSSAQGVRRRGGRSWRVMPRRWRMWLAVAGLVGVSAALAARAPVPDGKESPRQRSGSMLRLGLPPQQRGLGV
jgi:hypothetical protein